MASRTDRLGKGGLQTGVVALLLLLVAGVAAPGSAEATSSAAGVVAASIPQITSADADARDKCLDAENWGNGDDVQMWQCHGNANQKWTLDYVGTQIPGDMYRIRSSYGTKCVDAYRGARTQLALWTCDASGTQSFFVFTTSNGYLVFESVYRRGQCMDIRDWGRSHVVQLWDCHGGDNQLWRH